MSATDPELTIKDCDRWSTEAECDHMNRKAMYPARCLNEAAGVPRWNERCGVSPLIASAQQGERMLRPEPTGRKGRAGSALPSCSDVDLFRYRDSVIDLNTEVSDGALDLGMAQQELDRSQVACPSIDQGCLS